MSDIISEMLKGFSEAIVLSTIPEDGDYIYNIVKRIREESHDFFSITNPSVLFIFKRFYESGYVTYKAELNEKGISRKRYFLTEKGKEYRNKCRSLSFAALKEIYGLLKGGENNG